MSWTSTLPPLQQVTGRLPEFRETASSISDWLAAPTRHVRVWLCTPRRTVRYANIRTVAAEGISPVAAGTVWHKLPLEVVHVATRNVVLTEHQEKLIASLVGAGKYQNASEVLREGLRLLEREEQEFEARIQAFREAAQKGWDDIDAGHFTDLTDETLAEHVANIGIRAARAGEAS
jgi:antitoxin ParD1/3/4